MRKALAGLRRFIVTPYTAKFRVFMFVSGYTIPDAMAYAIASDDPFILGVLSSRVHMVWALAGGGRMGVGNDPRYTSTTTFAPFPFPACTSVHTERVRQAAEKLDSYRKERQAAVPMLTVTDMYNALEAFRTGNLSDRLRETAALVRIETLQRLHDDLDTAVSEAYGWEGDLGEAELIARIVRLNRERIAEERDGVVRWLRPKLQNPSGAPVPRQLHVPGIEPDAPAPAPTRPWPLEVPRRIAAVRDVLESSPAAWTIDRVAGSFKGAKKAQVREALESLSAVGLAFTYEADEGPVWTGRAAAG